MMFECSWCGGIVPPAKVEFPDRRKTYHYRALPLGCSESAGLIPPLMLRCGPVYRIRRELNVQFEQRELFS